MANTQEQRRSAQGTIFLVSVYPTATAGLGQGERAHVAGYYAGITFSTATEVAAVDVTAWRPVLRPRRR